MQNLLITNDKKLEYAEPILFETKVHWISLVLPVFKIFLGLIGIFILIMPTSIFKIIGLYFTYLFIKGLIDLMYLTSLRVYLTAHHLSVTAGILSKTTIDTPLHKRENVCLYQTLLGRMLNYGTFIISTGGITLTYILKNPKELRNQILKQI